MASRAKSAAEKLDSTPWTAVQVARAVLAFSEIERVPPYDEDAIRRHVRALLKMVQRVESGGVDDDALPMARTFVARGYQWLAEHPQYAPVTTKSWTTDMVEALILWFNQSIGSAVDRTHQVELAERVHTFERVVKAGAVDHEAETLADAFLDYARNWLESQPAARAHYQSL